MTEKQTELVKQLLQKTRAREATWERASSKNQYVLSMQSATIHIGVLSHAGSVKVIDPQGGVAEEFTTVRGQKGFNLMFDLYNAVETAITGKNETLNNALKELAASETVGRGAPLPP